LHQIGTQTIGESIVVYSNTIDSIDKNINKLFKLL